MIWKAKKPLIAAMAIAAAMSLSTEAFAQHARCDARARAAANDRVPTGGNVVGGAAAGAVGGAIIGGIIGGGRGAARGAAIGGGAGAVGGAGRSSIQWDRVYRRVYNRCMNRAADVGYGGAGPKPWSPAWYDYCSSKYRTFNPDTGYYFYAPGRQRFCR
ncbi:uncharacterized protein YcfJ [Rhodobium orientis]|nr:BA14K family protein [Rhodobium orientis]MBB4303563.1 uncharacterized protein YcfJ [Rhodobium orientis]